LIKLHAVRDIRKAVVISAGITGLACAFRLQQLGIRVLILEAGAKAGGVISTVRKNGFLFEAGPQCPRFPKSVWTLIRELGLKNEFIAGDPRAKRYILRSDELHRAPFSASGLLTTRLVSLKSKYRLLSEVFRQSHPPAREESLAEFVDRKFGAEVLDHLVDPFISTIFFGDPHKMGMHSAFPALVEWEQSRGSVVRGAIGAYRAKRKANTEPQVEGSSTNDSNLKHGDLHVTDALPSLGSFKKGMGTLVECLAEKLGEDLRLGANLEIDRLRRIQVERAREEAELAQRQYLLARPENRLVVDHLERQWNEKLTSLTQAEEEYARMSKSQPSALTEADRNRIHALASDLPRVWNDPRTPARDRKRVLRLLIEDVTLMKKQIIQIHVRWKAGATTSIERPLPLSAPDLVRTPPDIVELVRALATEQTDAQTARTLNARCLRTGRKHSFTRLIVRHIRNAYGVPSCVQYLRSQGWLTAPEIAAQMEVHSSTAKRFAAEGVLHAVRADDRGLVLFEPVIGPLPQARPGKRFRDRRRYPQLASNLSNEVQYEA